jgi:4-hydroxy-2-oxoheptanedioate aldolase
VAHGHESDDGRDVYHGAILWLRFRTVAAKNRIKETLADGGVAFGTWLQTPSPTVANILARSGMDFVTIDMEHGPHSFSEAETILYAIEAGGAAPMIRMGPVDAATILRACDIGCQSILVARCQSGEQAEAVVRAMTFQPRGDRGMAPFTRLHDWSSEDLPAKLVAANEEQLAGVLIEDADGLAHLDDILAVPNLDLVYVGIYDLSQTLGLPGLLEHPTVLDTVADVARRINAAGKAAGAVCRDRDHAEWLLANGFRYLSYLCDAFFIQSAARRARAEFDDLLRVHA